MKEKVAVKKSFALDYEMARYQRITHPFIATPCHSYVKGEFEYLFMKPFNLDMHGLDRSYILRPKHLKIWFITMLITFDYLHNYAFVAHNDLKLSNVLVEGNVEVFYFTLCDFSLARTKK